MVERQRGSWIKHYTGTGKPYFPCGCGDISWDGIKCQKGHENGYEPSQRKKIGRISGNSQMRKEEGYKNK